MTTRVFFSIAAALGVLIAGLAIPLTAAPDPNVEWERTMTAAEKAMQRQAPESEQLLKTALEFAEETKSESRLAYVYDALASVEQDRGDFLKAEKDYRFSIYHWERAASSNAGLARTLNNQASLFFQTGRLSKAAESLLRADEIQSGEEAPNSPDHAARLLRLGMVYSRLKHYDQAETMYDKALSIWEKQRIAPLVDIAATSGNLAVVYLATGRTQDAKRLFREAELVWVGDEGLCDESLEPALTLAEMLRNAGQKAEAESLAKKVVTFAEAKFGPVAPEMVRVLRAYAKTLRDLKKSDEAKELEKRAKEIAKRRADPSSADYTVDLGELRSQTGHGRQAETAAP